MASEVTGDPSAPVSLLTPDISIRVSSTLSKEVGKRCLVDNNPETCWTSQQGLPQVIQITFPQPAIPLSASLTFQGGFVGTRCSVSVLCASSEESASGESEKKWRTLTDIYPENVNRRQDFELKPSTSSEVTEAAEGIKFTFHESSDFFGRITIYQLDIRGIFIE